MANSYFQFKQFTVQQGRCAMKVTTDGCLFGAVVAKEISHLPTGKILDIGAGTGLLSLMVAQENAAVQIDAVEIDKAAAEQAKENVAASPWKERINVLQGNILRYHPELLYDLIISNPPFYEQQLASPTAGRTLAHHSSGLTLEQLFQQVKRGLKKDGKFYVLLPFYRTNEAVEIADKFDLYPQKKWLIRQSVKHDFFRTVFCFGSGENESPRQAEIAIRDEQNAYTQSFAELLQPFYLKL